MTKHIARIVPAIGKDGLPILSNGTQVWIGNVRLEGVYAITLRAEIDALWRATIECYVEPPAELLVEADVLSSKRERWYQRVIRRAFGKPLDVTSLSSPAREYRR